MKKGQRFVNKNKPQQELTIKDADGKYCLVEITNYVVVDYFGEVSSGIMTKSMSKSEIESQYKQKVD